VRLYQPGTSLEEVRRTDATGAFQFKQLIQGDYQLTVVAEGFAVLDKTLRLSEGDERSLGLVLPVKPVAEQVVVSASHLFDVPERVNQIPGSVDIIDKETIENSRPLNFTEVLRKVPGVYVREDEGFGARPHISIRGVNPTRSTKVLLLEDGIPLTYAPYGDNASYYHPPVDRYESIEVLKGSSQILYGPSTVSGVINYVTPNPPPRPSGYAALTGGNNDYFNAHLNYGGTWGHTGLLFDYLRKQGDGARENVQTGINDVNFKVLTGFGSRHALTLRGNYYNEKSNVTYSGLREDEYQQNPRQNAFRNDFFYGDRYGLSATHSYVFSNALILTTNLYGSLFSRDWWRQSSNSNQRPNDAADPACGGMANLNTTCGNEGRLRDYYNWGLEPRLQADHKLFGVRSETDFGFRLHYERQNRRQMNGDKPWARSGVLVEDNQRKNQAYSGFVQNRFLLGKWTLTPGLRVEHIDYERTNRLASSGLAETGRTDLTQLVPGLSVSYRPAEQTTIFAGVYRGFAPPRTEDVITNTGGTVELDPELSWNYELGVRSVPRPGLALEGTFFRLDYENQIIPASLAGGLGATLTNGGETLQEGIELATRVDTGPLRGSKHNFYSRLAYTYLPIARFTGSRFSSIPGFGSVSVSGNRLPYAPEQLLNLTLGYSYPSGIDALLEATYVSDQFGDDLNIIDPTPDGQRGLIPSYTIWNATFNYDVEKWRSTLFVTVKNLFDRTYIVDRTRGILPGSPRLFEAGVKFHF
jgi:Fe(3+) dicitrate transport protein